MSDCQQAAPKTDDGVTYNNWGNIGDYDTTPIDFCFVSKDKMKPLTFEINREKWNGTNYYSDHYALKTTVRVSYDAISEISAE